MIWLNVIVYLCYRWLRIFKMAQQHACPSWIFYQSRSNFRNILSFAKYYQTFDCHFSGFFFFVRNNNEKPIITTICTKLILSAFGVIFLHYITKHLFLLTWKSGQRRNYRVNILTFRQNKRILYEMNLIFRWNYQNLDVYYLWTVSVTVQY